MVFRRRRFMADDGILVDSVLAQLTFWVLDQTPAVANSSDLEMLVDLVCPVR